VPLGIHVHGRERIQSAHFTENGHVVTLHRDAWRHLSRVIGSGPEIQGLLSRKVIPDDVDTRPCDFKRQLGDVNGVGLSQHRFSRQKGDREKNQHLLHGFIPFLPLRQGSIFSVIYLEVGLSKCNLYGNGSIKPFFHHYLVQLNYIPFPEICQEAKVDNFSSYFCPVPCLKSSIN